MGKTQVHIVISAVSHAQVSAAWKFYNGLHGRDVTFVEFMHLLLFEKDAQAQAAEALVMKLKAMSPQEFSDFLRGQHGN